VREEDFSEKRKGSMAYLSDEEQRQRIIEVLHRKAGVECPELAVIRIMEAFGPAIVIYTCKEGETSKNMELTEEEAVYIGLDRSVPDMRDTNR
jgi:hypothetical protein